ncbi:response regulator [Streptomyces albireticuli]|uniref:DNA-binding response regulator n=1 Tax=Streptomyces albireticuli TaxID=1940 RepID=A0A2A2DGS2_9ACTN|nr:response regulator transcription factor [Streptomyces albireticuli]MCD9143684.1 response regulator transcription factor [Streptomyces albireticuli]MCD9161885.1 response regulator transcription factor [Streptomyces albireticuli]MCD9191801.1 response regulator transcription factor [Streptomyces albireticuli]PAU50452.1 DNA-binding response regulator [Streptomyces albireticuli]
MDTIRILIADDHTLLRNALAEILQTTDEFEVVATAGSAPEAIRLAAEHQPDITLLDIGMPGNAHPPTTVRKLQQAAPSGGVLVLTMHDDPQLVQALLPLGIRGFLHKTVSHQALFAAVREATTPGSRITLSLSAESLAAPPPPAPGPLSPREAQVVELAAHGLSNYQIARRLDITEGTVKRHMRNIFDKLGVGSRVEAANKSVELGLIEPPVAAPKRMSRRYREYPESA